MKCVTPWNDSVKKRAYRVVHFVGIGLRHFVHASGHFARRITDLFEAAVFFQFLDQFILDPHERSRETNFLELKFTFERPFSGNALANWWPCMLLAMSAQTDFNVSSRALAICRCTKAKRRAKRNIACFTRVGISRENRETKWAEQLRRDGYLHRCRIENDTDWSHTPWLDMLLQLIQAVSTNGLIARSTRWLSLEGSSAVIPIETSRRRRTTREWLSRWGSIYRAQRSNSIHRWR